jgi:hypothetical protein
MGCTVPSIKVTKTLYIEKRVYMETGSEDTDRTELLTIFTEYSQSKQCCDIFDNITLLLGHTQFSLKIRPLMYWYYVHTRQVAAVTACTL